ncbi:MAG TPA: hypothetical protein VN915_00350 [Elusimicrobiota bacterium]|nr:hypothetical protein [Elusimicrobiota bacterium]
MAVRTPFPPLLLGALLVPSFCAAAGLVDKLEADLKEGRLRECAREASAEGIPPRASYLGGLCALGLNDRDAAEPLLKRAKDGNFYPTASWRKSPDELLSQIAEYRRLAPEFAKIDDVPESSLRVGFDKRSEWVDSVVSAAPEFVRIGRRVFGADPPFTRLFLYSDNAVFEEFFGAVFKSGHPHGTGVPGLAVMTEKNAVDRKGRLPVAVVLHELMHAWIQGYGRDEFDRRINVPPWMDEGMADYVASMYDTDMLALRRTQLAREVAKRPQPPDFAELQEHESFYRPEDSFFHYVLALMLVERLVGPPETGAPALRKVLDSYAKGKGEESWRRVSGKSPSDEYSALCNELWKQNAH